MKKEEIPSIALVPKRLEIKGKPELQYFPLNIVFATVTMQNGPKIASAVYEPDLNSYKESDDGSTLLYYNTLSRLWIVSILKTNNNWQGEKLAEDKRVRISMGSQWKDFFTQLTIGGLNKGEPCTFEDIANFLPVNKKRYH